MRRLMPLFVLLLAACGGEPDFDQRYAEAERRIANKAAAMEHDLKAPDRPSQAPPK